MLADAPAADWLALRGDRRLMMETFAPSEELSLIKRRLYYSARPPRGPEQPVAAVPAAVGIQTTGWERLSGGPHRFNPLLISAPVSYGAKRVIEEASTAPVVTVRQVSKSNLPPAAQDLISQVPATFSEDGR